MDIHAILMIAILPGQEKKKSSFFLTSYARKEELSNKNSKGGINEGKSKREKS